MYKNPRIPLIRLSPPEERAYSYQKTYTRIYFCHLQHYSQKPQTEKITNVHQQKNGRSIFVQWKNITMTIQPTITHKFTDQSHTFNTEHKKPDAKEGINRIQEAKLIYGEDARMVVVLRGVGRPWRRASGVLGVFCFLI